MPKLIDDSIGTVGAIMSAMLTESQFQSLHGSGWILADGRSVTGSKYAAVTGTSAVPDMRGLALRGKNNGRSDGKQNPDGEVSLGSYQADANQAHGHNAYTGPSNVTGSNTIVEPGIATVGVISSYTLYRDSRFGGGNTYIQASGASESRMRNVTVNHFIRIN